MSDTKTFKQYNFVTGAVDGTLAYDFSVPELYPDEEIYETPRKRQKEKEKRRQKGQDWIREDLDRDLTTSLETARSLGIHPLAVAGTVVVVILFVCLLLAKIQLVRVSDSAVTLESQISELKADKEKLTVEYETIFNLKDVEDYAKGYLGMQEPRADQIYYLSDVASTDKAVVIDQGEDAGFLFSGLEDVVASLKSYFS